MKPETERLIVFAALLAGWVALCIALAGCGGGGDDPPDQQIGPPDCRARPELCQ